MKIFLLLFTSTLMTLTLPLAQGQYTHTQWGNVELNEDGTYNIEARFYEFRIDYFRFTGEIKSCDQARKV